MSFELSFFWIGSLLKGVGFCVGTDSDGLGGRILVELVGIGFTDSMVLAVWGWVVVERGFGGGNPLIRSW